MNSDLKFNVDGSALGKPGPARIGGVLRDSKGKVLCMFSFYVGVQDSNTAELMAIHKAVDLYCSSITCMGRNLEISRDSMVAVSWINRKGIGCVKYVNLIYDIRSKLQKVGGAVRFFSRSSNHFADRLVKSGSSKSGDCVEWGDTNY
ncbi:hypothetical protein Q3G72_006906 [Acer saccharum]|nr:hypothetical protein Q3G72_006906 [Acer saccharum]